METLRFYIARPGRMHTDRIEISEEEFRATQVAHRSLVIVAAIEEKLDLLIESYIEYESTLLNLALRYSVAHHFEHDLFMADRRLVARRLVSLLSSARMYVDQVCHEISKLYGKDSGQFAQLEKGRNADYDASFGIE